MTINISLEELLAWNAEERTKWLTWLKANPHAMSVPVQPGGRFPTVGALIDHIFLVEVRHTHRLQGKELPTESGASPNDIDALFTYADRGREGVKQFLTTVRIGDLDQPRDVKVANGVYRMSPRKLLFHMVLHEVRHWAQIAAAVRVAGFAPPGDHDLFYSSALI
jgi:uncharacterized damage-inducible protein DinB